VSVTFEVRGRCAILTIDRPEARNAVNAAVAAGIEAGIDRIEADDELWVGILTGTPPAFCAGADLREVQGGTAGGMFTERGGFGGFAARQRAKPFIAAVDGPALAGGTELVLAADLVVATGRSTFGIPEVKRSLVAGAGGLFRLPRKIPENVAMECALTGDPISADRAAHFGLVNELVDDGVVAAALALADRIVANGPLAVRESRRVVLASAHLGDDDAFAVSRQAMDRVAGSADLREGVAAFIEKRSPQWTGR
jgi:enoyl-CoA hydratase